MAADFTLGKKNAKRQHKYLLVNVCGGNDDKKRSTLFGRYYYVRVTCLSITDHKFNSKITQAPDSLLNIPDFLPH